MKDIILIGAGGHAVSCIDVIEKASRFRIAGLVGVEAELHQRICGYEVIATDRDLHKLATDFPYALITVGQIKSAESRIRLYTKVREAGFELPVIVSPLAHVSRHAQIAEGSIVMHYAMVNACAQIGVNCIINSGALVEHGVQIGDHCHISTRAILNGDAQVGAASFIGSGAIAMQGVSIGTGCLVGMASVIRHDVSDKSTFYSGARCG